MSQITELYPLHQNVFNNDVASLTSLLPYHDVAETDKHGNTALHLAAMLGRKECINILLENNAPIKFKNTAGWRPLDEAISYGNHEIVSLFVEKGKEQCLADIDKVREDALVAIRDLGNFFAEIKWELETWVPLISTFLPSDTCRIYKKDTRLRIDTTLTKYKELKCGGDRTVILDITPQAPCCATVLDNKAKTWKTAVLKNTKKGTNEIVDSYYKSEIMSLKASTKTVKFKRDQKGWFFKGNRQQNVGRFKVNNFNISGITLDFQTRWEHLHDKSEPKNNESEAESITSKQSSLDNKKINPPSAVEVTWADYINAPEGKHPCLGRPLVLKSDTTSLKGTISMSEDFPLSLDTLLRVLELTTSLKNLDKLKTLLETTGPSGFPVKIELRIPPFLTARFTLRDIDLDREIPDTLFEIPIGYKEKEIQS